jgi:nucleoid-associated protein YgaU
VQPGDDLWTIAHNVQSLSTGRTPTEQETAAYWTQLVAANRDRLAEPDNPDLIFSGQIIHLPNTP